MLVRKHFFDDIAAALIMFHAPPEAASAPEGVVVAETGGGQFVEAIEIGRHRLRADEPKEVGGDDLRPGAYDYLLAGLGACTSMTLRLFAERKGLPLAQVAAGISHEIIQARDCIDCDTKENRLDQIAPAPARDR